MTKEDILAFNFCRRSQIRPNHSWYQAPPRALDTADEGKINPVHPHPFLGRVSKKFLKPYLTKLAGPACQEHCQRCWTQFSQPGFRTREYWRKSTVWVCRVDKGWNQLSDGLLELPIWHSILSLYPGALELGLPASELPLSQVKSTRWAKHQDELWHRDCSLTFRASCETSRAGGLILIPIQISNSHISLFPEWINDAGSDVSRSQRLQNQNCGIHIQADKKIQQIHLHLLHSQVKY